MMSFTIFLRLVPPILLHTYLCIFYRPSSSHTPPRQRRFPNNNKWRRDPTDIPMICVLCGRKVHTALFPFLLQIPSSAVDPSSDFSLFFFIHSDHFCRLLFKAGFYISSIFLLEDGAGEKLVGILLRYSAGFLIILYPSFGGCLFIFLTCHRYLYIIYYNASYYFSIGPRSFFQKRFAKLLLRQLQALLRRVSMHATSPTQNYPLLHGSEELSTVMQIWGLHLSQPVIMLV